MQKKYEWIGGPEELARMAERIRGEKMVGLDTEFVWDRTYYARLGLVQIGLADGTCFLVDAPGAGDLSPLGDLLADGGTTKILHDAPQDLMILRRATGVAARNVFDTRLAAGFAGLASTISLGKLLEELLGLKLEKAHTRADWLARPLSEAELEYAADDVLHLPRAAELLRERARAAGTEAWMDEEMGGIEAAAPDDARACDEAYLRIRAAGNLGGRQLAALRELAGWREREARRADLPRRWVMEDGELVGLAMALPADLAGGGIDARKAKRYGEELLEAIGRAKALPDSAFPPPVFKAGRDAETKKALDDAMEAIRRRAEGFGMDPALVCSRGDAARLLQEGLAARPEEHALLRGWRGEFVRGASAFPVRGRDVLF